MSKLSIPPAFCMRRLKSLAFCLCFLASTASGVEPIGGKDEEAKAVSGKNFAEDIPPSGSAGSSQAKKMGTQRGVEFSAPKAKNPPVLPVPNMSQGGEINDISRLNPMQLHSMLMPKTEREIRAAILFARANGLGVSAAGARHSMGGQIAQDGNVLLDLEQFKGVRIDKEKKEMTVQSGARWKDIQPLLNEQGLALDVAQTLNIFSVGGALSVNAHGSNPFSGPVASTVKSLRIMLADGSIVEASREKNSELFHAALGGYGMVGIILDAKLQVRDNEVYSVQGDRVKTEDYPEYFAKNVRGDARVKYVHAMLSTAPNSFFKHLSVMKYMVPEEAPEKIQGMDNPMLAALKERGMTMMFGLAKSKIGQEIFWNVSGRMTLGLAQFMKFSRNQAMAEPIVGFKSNDPRETQLLHEYFLPIENWLEFVQRTREILLKNNAMVTLAVARGVAADKDSMLAYAPQDRLALVMFFNQKISPEENEKMAAMTRELINAAISLGGRFYLPYQLVYSDEQLRKAYPNIEKFFEVKRKYDPDEMFMNKWYAKYGKK